MDAVISDIHGNLEALSAVLHAVQELRVSRIICLGDLACFGPDTVACIRQSAAWDVVIAGDWDLAMLDHEPTDWLPAHNRNIVWDRNEIRSATDADKLLLTLRSYRTAHIEGKRTFVHGTPRDVREWIFPEDTYNPEKLNRIAEQFDALCICGHSHIPGLFVRRDDGTWEFILPDEGKAYDLAGNAKAIVTVGSVGQPRDGDARAAFLTIDDKDRLRFHRVEYDVASTVAKIHAIPAIDNVHGDRLLEGR